jgi:hypothetical protein
MVWAMRIVSTLLMVLVLAIPAFILPSSVTADDGGQALSEGCGASAARDFDFGPAVASPFKLYDLSADYPDAYPGVYFELVYGEVSLAVEIGETLYTAEQILAMSTSERAQLARDLFEQEGDWEYTVGFLNDFEKLAGRRSYKYLRSYCEWRVAVSRFEAGITKYWIEAGDQNPNAERFFETARQSTSSRTDREVVLTSTWAFLAIAGIQPYLDSALPLETNDFDPVGVANHFPP